MEYIATFDIGTTAVKGVLVSKDHQVLSTKSKTLKTISQGNVKEQNPLDWYNAFCTLSRQFFEEGYDPKRVTGIIMSGQMQDLITVDEKMMPVANAILYSDGRAAREAEYILNLIGMEEIMQGTGNHFDGSMPFAKLVWIRDRHPEIFKRIFKIMISAKDYCLARLTGRFVTDVVSASTSGMMDIHAKTWKTGWLAEMALSSDCLPEILHAEDVVGSITQTAARESGYPEGIPVYAGSGDAGSTTLASGVSVKGDLNINIGTSGWIAAMSDKVLNRSGVFNLAAVPKDRYINVVPFLNAGGVHKWISGILSKNEIDYDYVNQLIKESEIGSGGLLFLPYLNGERFPVLDTEVRGCYIGIDSTTSKGDMARACLEGVAFSIRQGYEALGVQAEMITLIGGGAQVDEWSQTLADVFGKTIYVSSDAEYMPAISLAAAVAIAEKRIDSYESFISRLIQENNFTSFQPRLENITSLEMSYNRFLTIYPHVKTLF